MSCRLEKILCILGVGIKTRAVLDEGVVSACHYYDIVFIIIFLEQVDVILDVCPICNDI